MLTEVLLALLLFAVSGIAYLLERRLKSIEESLGSLWRHVRLYLPHTP